MNEQSVLALDLGGTKLLIGEVDHTGAILNSKRYPTGRLSLPEEVALIKQSIADYMETVGFVHGLPTNMGIGMIGQINHKDGIWELIYPGEPSPYPLVQDLEQTFSMKCSIENDVKASTQGEKRFGAAKNINHFIYINLGTGIAAGIVSEGRLVRGIQNDAGEIGHMTLKYDSDIPCICGRYGCAEAIASGAGLDRRVRMLSKAYPASILTGLSQKGFVPAQEIFRAAKSNDALASLLVQDAVTAISELIMNLSWTFNPQLIILGGGLAGSSFLQMALQKELKKTVFDKIRDRIVYSALNPAMAGLIGAAAVAFEPLS